MTAAGDAKALGAATCWALQQFEQHFAEASEEDAQAVEANSWKLLPSVGTWFMSQPRSLAEVADVPVAAKGETSSSTMHATPRKARASGVVVAKSKSSPKPEARRTPCRSPDGASRTPGLAKPVRSVQARATSPLAKPVVPSEPPASETLTPSRKREAVGTKLRVKSPKPQPKTDEHEPVPSSAPVDDAASIEVPAAEPSQHVNELAPNTLQLEEKKAAQPQGVLTQKTKCNPAVKPRSPSLQKDKMRSPSVPKDKLRSPSVPKERPRAKSPSVAISKPSTKSAPQESTASRAAQKMPGSTKGLSSADIEAKEIEDSRKQAKLLAEKNARRMNRAPSSKTITQAAAAGPGSPAAPVASSSTTGRDDKSSTPAATKAGAAAGAQQARRPSPLRKTQAVPDKASAVGGVAKAVVAATPRPVKSTAAAATSPRLRRPSAPAEASKSAAAPKSSVAATASRTKPQVVAASQAKPFQRPPSPTSAQRAAKAAASPPLRKATTTPRNGSVKVAADVPKASSAAESASKEDSSAVPA